MLPNGITSSALCLLDNIDHGRFDVTVTFPHTTRSTGSADLADQPECPASLPRFGGINGGKLEVAVIARGEGTFD